MTTTSTGPTMISSQRTTIGGGTFIQNINPGGTIPHVDKDDHIYSQPTTPRGPDQQPRSIGDRPPPNPRPKPRPIQQHPQEPESATGPITGTTNVPTETSSSTSAVRPIVQPTSGPIHPNSDVATQPSPISQPSTSTPTHQLVQNHLSDSADRALFSVYSKGKSRELYQVAQTEIRFGKYDQIPYSILGFRLQRGDHRKQCLEVKLTGAFTQSDKFKNVDVKYLWHKPSKENKLVELQIQNILTDQLQGQVGISGNNPTGLLTFSHSQSTSYTLTAGQEIVTHFNESPSKETFSITLSLDHMINHEPGLSVANSVIFLIVLKLQKDRQPMELNLKMDVTYKSASLFGRGIQRAPASDMEVYTGNSDHDIIKNQSEILTMPSSNP